MVLNSSSLTHFDIGFHIANVTGDELRSVRITKAWKNYLLHKYKKKYRTGNDHLCYRLQFPATAGNHLVYIFFPNKLAKFPLNNISEEFLLPVIPFERLLQSHIKLNEITDLQGFFSLCSQEK